MISNNNLLNAYFSKNLDDLEKFYSDLEKQPIITREHLCSLVPNINDEELLAKIIVDSIEYNKAYNNEIDTDSYSNIINYLDNFYILDHGSWNELINKVKMLIKNYSNMLF